MPIRKSQLVSGSYYHVFNRGVAGMKTFEDNRDYDYALSIMNYYQYNSVPMSFSALMKVKLEEQANIWQTVKTSLTRRIEILAFYLMPNHFHLLVRQDTDKGISKFMADFSNSLSRFYNIRHSRYGPLFQGRFKSVLVEDEQQLLHLSRYIHINGYTSFLINNLNDLFNYPYSSLREYYGIPILSNPELILDLAGGRDAYRDFIVDRLSYQRELHLIKDKILD